MNPVTERAINELGIYYGIRSSDAYMRAILGETLNTPEDAQTTGEANAESSTPAERAQALEAEGDKFVNPRLRLFQYMISVGNYFPTINAICSYITDTEIPDDEIKKDVCITPSPNDEQLHTGHPIFNKMAKDQGMGGGMKDDIYTSIDATPFKQGDEFGVPVFTPALNFSVIQIFPANFSPAQSEREAAAIFLNSLPTLQLSRASPYLDISVLTTLPAISNSASTNELSLGRFLLGETMSPDDASSGLMTSADAEQPGGETDSAGKAVRKLTDMEIFTSPQTLIGEKYLSGEAKYNENSETAVSNPRDPFRPFMSVLGVDFEGVGLSRAVPLHTRAKLKLKLHDMTRLGDIAALTIPNGSTSYYVKLRWGWSHPAGTSKLGYAGQGASGAQSGEGDRIGELIDSAKAEGLYICSKASMDFESNGEVGITLNLSDMSGTSDEGPTSSSKMADVDILSPYVQHMPTVVTTVLQPMMDTIKALKPPKDGKRGSTERKARKDFIKNQKFIAKAGAGFKNMWVRTDALTKLTETMKGLSNIPDPEEGQEGAMDEFFKEALEIMKQLAGEGDGRIQKDQELDKARVADPGKYLENIFDYMGNMRDPFATPLYGNGKTYSPLVHGPKMPPAEIEKISFDALQKVDPNVFEDFVKAVKDAGAEGAKVELRYKYVSVGKLLSTFLAAPLAASGKLGEIQLVFGCFNASASWLWYKNIAQCPIEISKIKAKTVRAWKRGKKLTPLQFFGLVKAELASPAAPAYGLGSTGAGFSKKKGGAHSPTSNKSKVDDALKEAYGITADAGTKDIEFRMPHLDLKAYTRPGCSAVIADPDHLPIDGNKVVKIVISDVNVNTNLYLSRVSSGEVLLPNYDRKAPPIAEERSSQWGDIAAYELEMLENLNMVSSIDAAVKELTEQGVSEDEAKKLLNAKDNKYIVNTNQPFGLLKRNLSALIPTLVLNSEASGILSVSYDTNLSGGAKNQIQMSAVKGGLDTDKARKDMEKEGGERQLPMRVIPMGLSLECVGCPFIRYDQKYFIDLGTNTTLDNVYVVRNYSHSLEAGSFKTKVTLAYAGAAVYESFSSSVQSTSAAVAKAKAARAAQDGEDAGG